MKLNDYHYALSLLNSLYGIDISEEDFEEISLVWWNLIGNKRTRLYKYSTCAGNSEEGVQLPCNCYEVEAVTTNFEEWNYSTNDTPNGDINSAFIEAYTENRKAFKDPFYSSGKYIRYERVGDMLYFENSYDKVNILYKGLVLDDNGLPQITDKEAMALATYCAYIIKFKEGIMTNNKNIIELSNILK